MQDEKMNLQDGDHEVLTTFFNTSWLRVRDLIA
jgi:hypothetical protein